MLLLDKIFELSEAHVIGSKNVTMNEEFFKGHFPGAPVMPYYRESNSANRGNSRLSTVPDPKNYLTFL